MKQEVTIPKLEEIDDELSILYHIVGILIDTLGYGLYIKPDKKGNVESIKLEKKEA